jgi:hypothetical protein
MQRRVFFATAMDGRNKSDVARRFSHIEQRLERIGLTLSNPFSQSPDVLSSDQDARSLIGYDLDILRASDYVLVDLSIPGHIYIGCVGELTYAYLAGIPTIVVVGETGLQHRLWIKYHATHISIGLQDALDYLGAWSAGLASG